MVVLCREVSGEHRMLDATLIIFASNELVLIVVVGYPIPDLPARVIRDRNVFQKVHRRFAKQCRAHLIVLKRGGQRDLPSAVTRRRGGGSEVSRAHRGRRDES